MVLDFESNTRFRPRLMLSLAVFGTFSLLLGGYTIGSNYYAVSGYGDWGVPTQEMVSWLCLLGMGIMAVSLLGLFASQLRQFALAVFFGSALLVVVGLATLRVADGIRAQGFARLAREAAPLVAAIHAYQEEFGLPPQSLDLLQVHYPAGHVIKGGGLPAFEYIPGRYATERYHGNPWVLLLETPTGPLRWDRFLYYPLQNYPSLGHGGWLEKVADWAYVHD